MGIAIQHVLAINGASNITYMHTLLGYLFGGQGVVIIQLEKYIYYLSICTCVYVPMCGLCCTDITFTHVHDISDYLIIKNRPAGPHEARDWD